MLPTEEVGFSLDENPRLKSLRQSYMHEYDKAIEFVKHYATIQFAQLSVFVTFAGATLAFLYGKTAPTEPSIRSVLIAFACGVSLLFWIMQESHMYITSHFLRRCAYIERALGYQGLSRLPGMPDYKYGPAKLSIRVFYFLSFALFVLLTMFEAKIAVMEQPLPVAAHTAPPNPAVQGTLRDKAAQRP